MAETISHSIKEEKLKTLIPTLRNKKRFVKIKIKCEYKFDFKDLSEDLTNELIYYIGAIDFGKGGIWFLKDKFNQDKQELVIKVGTKFKDKLVASLNLINKIKNKNIEIEILKISGTLKGLEK